MTDKQQKIEALQKTMQEMEESFQVSVDTVKKQIEDLEKSGSVEMPTQGFFRNLKEGILSVNGSGLTLENIVILCKKGRVFSTGNQAEDTHKTVTESYMIAQYLYAKEPDYVPDWGSNDRSKFSVVYCTLHRRYEAFSAYSIMVRGVVYMPEHVARQLAEELNNGTYSLEGFK